VSRIQGCIAIHRSDVADKCILLTHIPTGRVIMGFQIETAPELVEEAARLSTNGWVEAQLAWSDKDGPMLDDPTTALTAAAWEIINRYDDYKVVPGLGWRRSDDLAQPALLADMELKPFFDEAMFKRGAGPRPHVAIDIETETRWPGTGPKNDYGLSYCADVRVISLAWRELGQAGDAEGMSSTVLVGPFPPKVGEGAARFVSPIAAVTSLPTMPCSICVAYPGSPAGPYLTRYGVPKRWPGCCTHN